MSRGRPRVPARPSSSPDWLLLSDFTATVVLTLLARFGGRAGLRAAGRRRLLTVAGKAAPPAGEQPITDLLAALDEKTVVVPGSAAAEKVLPRLAIPLTQVPAQRQQIAAEDIAAEVEGILDAHPLAKVLTSMPGIGVRTAARILLEVGDGAASRPPGTWPPTPAWPRSSAARAPPSAANDRPAAATDTSNERCSAPPSPPWPTPLPGPLRPRTRRRQTPRRRPHLPGSPPHRRPLRDAPRRHRLPAPTGLTEPIGTPRVCSVLRSPWGRESYSWLSSGVVGCSSPVRPAPPAPGHDPDAAVGPRHSTGHAGPGEQPARPHRRTFVAILLAARRGPAGTDRRDASQSARVGRGHRRLLIGRRSETRGIPGHHRGLQALSSPSAADRPGRSVPRHTGTAIDSEAQARCLGSGGRGTAACPAVVCTGFPGLVVASFSSPCWRVPSWQPVAGAAHRHDRRRRRDRVVLVPAATGSGALVGREPVLRIFAEPSNDRGDDQDGASAGARLT